MSSVVAAALPAYEIGPEVGRGGFGVVRSGRHRQLGRLVAIKELPEILVSDSAVRTRFSAEARILAGFDHPHIVPVYDFVEQPGLCLVVMEYLPGGSVWSHVTERGATVETACAVVLGTCAALQYAHRQGVLHRDVKPENLLFSAEGQLKLTDFGIAKVVGGGDALVTAAGDILGTPAYMAPEQAQGTDLGPPADVYGTGVMLYELLSGQLPFAEEGGPLAIVYRHVHEQPRPLLSVAPHVPRALAEVTMRALARDPGDRYPSAEAFGVALAEAANVEWGPGWLARADMSLHVSSAILAAAERETASVGGGVVTLAGPARPPVPPAPTGLRPPMVVRPTTGFHVAGALADGARGDELAPVRQVLDPPRRPLRLALATAALAGVVVLTGVRGLGAPAEAVAPGEVVLDGVDVASPGAIPLDLTRPVTLRLGAGGEAVPAPPAATARLRLTAGGLPVAESAAAPLTATDGGTEARVDLRGARFLAAGRLRAEVTVSGADGSPAATHVFAARAQQAAWRTVPGVIAIGLSLFVAAYAESHLRHLRRGRRRVAGAAGMAVAGAGAGIVVVLGSWLAGTTDPSVATAAACGAGGAVAGVLLAVTTVRSGQRRRARRAARAAVLAGRA